MKRKGFKSGLLLALLCALAFGLTGCAVDVQERAMEDTAGISIEAPCEAPTQDGFAAREERVTLYFIKEDGSALVPVTRSIPVENGMSTAEAAFYALLAGPYTNEADRYGASWPDLGGSSGAALEVSGRIAAANLPARVRELPQEMIYAVRQAVTNTLTEFSPIAYVNVLVGGREEGFDLGATLPVGTMTRASDTDLSTPYARMDDQRQSGGSITRLTTLYFPTEDGSMLIPEMRSIDYASVSPIEYLYTLLTELGKGPTGSLAADDVPAPLEYIEEMPEIVRTSDGAYRAIDIRFDSGLDEALLSAGLTRGIYLAMLTHTLMGFVPGVEGLQVTAGSELIDELDQAQTPDGCGVEFEHALITRASFEGYIAAECTLYVQSAKGNGLSRVSRAIAQSEQEHPRERLIGLMQLSQGEDVFALPDGLTGEDILAVRVDETRIAVNLSRRFAQKLSSLDETQERASVYAMVNTLTEGSHAQRVCFFFEGEQVSALAGGLEMRGEFLRNPGMVVE